MIRVVLATHGGLGKAMLETAALISCGTENVRTIELYPGGGAEDVEAALRQELSELEEGDEVLCLVDIPGGSPARAAAGLVLESPSLHVVSGLNLGMLAEALLLKDSMDIEQLKGHIMTAATGTIVDLGSKLLEQLQEDPKAKKVMEGIV